MPIFKEINHEHARIFIWQIAEDEDFFQRQMNIPTEIHHPKRRIEYIVGRYLLQMMTPDIDLSLIKTNESGKPYCDEYDFNFSISHSYPFVAVGVIFLKEIGIDIQLYNDKVLRIKDKFLTEEEQTLCHDNDKFYNLMWNAKEAIFKWIGTGGQTFKEDFLIKKITPLDDSYKIDAIINTSDQGVQHKTLIGQLFPEFSMAYIVDAD